MITLSPDVRRLVEDAAYAADLEPDRNLRFDYSGRAMYGRACLAVVGTVGDLVRFVATLTRAIDELAGYSDDDADAYERYDAASGLLDAMIHDTSQDNMGLSLVFYWPRVQVTS